MKKIVVSLVALAFVLVSFTSVEKKQNVELVNSTLTEITFQGNVDVASSVLYWKGSKPTGSHNGTIKLKDGSLRVNNGNIDSGTFVVDMSTIKNLDIKSEKYAANLVKHLSNADFFDVTKYPTSKFVVTKSENKNGKLEVTGDLTIKGITKSISFPASLSESNGVITFKSDTFEINRAHFNVRYGSKSFFNNLKNKFINDMIEMSFEVKAKR